MTSSPNSIERECDADVRIESRRDRRAHRSVSTAERQQQSFIGGVGRRCNQTADCGMMPP
jgi:hypothetical protein